MNSKIDNLASQSNKIESLQIVRALAFLCIFTSHCGITQLGAAGVSIFLILSGFVMFYSYYYKNVKISFWNNFKFSLKKIWKLYPLHIFTMIIAIFITTDVSIKTLTIKGIIKILANVFLIQAWIPNRFFYFSLNGVAWYLSASIFLYAMFPFILNKIKKIKSIKTSLLVIVIIYMIQILLGYISNYIYIPHSCYFVHWFTYIFPIFRLGDFCIGCLLGFIFLHIKTNNMNKHITTLLEIGTFLLFFIENRIYVNQIGYFGQESFKYTMLFLPTSILIVFLFAVNKGFISKILNCKPVLFFGNISAYTFLIHFIVIQYLGVIFPRFELAPHKGFIFIIALIITIICVQICIWIKSKIFKFKYILSINKC